MFDINSINGTITLSQDITTDTQDLYEVRVLIISCFTH